MEQPKRRLSAVWFADIVGYSSLSTHDEPAAMGLVELLQALCREIVPAHEGRVVKFIGDACLAEFASTDSAVRSAVALLERYIAGAAEHGQPSSLRIGVHLGEVTAAPDGDLYGDGINTASRLQHSAAPGQVIISEDVWRQLRQRPEFRFAPLGSLELRGITTQVQVYDVLFGSRAAVAPAVISSPAPAPVPPAASGNLRSLGFFVAVILLGIAIWVFSDSLQQRSEPPSEPPVAVQQQAPPASAPVATEPAPKPSATAPSTVKGSTPPPSTPPVVAAPAAEAVATDDTAAARGRAGRSAMMAQFHPAEVRALLQRMVDAMNNNASADAFVPLGPAAVTAMTGRGAQQMRESFGAGLSMRLGRIDAAPLNGGRLPVKFVVLAKSDTRSEMPMIFIALIDRDPQGQLKIVDLRREIPGRRGR